MVGTIRAVYEHGVLRPLDPLDLAEGQEVYVTVLLERERARIALKAAGLLVEYPPTLEDDLDEEAVQAEIDAELQGTPPISDLIIQERHEGP